MKNQPIENLYSRKEELQLRSKSIIETGESEQRKLSEEEEKEMQANKAEIEQIDAEIASRSNVKVTEKNNTNPMEKELRLSRLIRSAVRREAMDEASLNLINEGREQMRMAGLDTAGDIFIPNMETRGVITASNNALDVQKFDIVAPVLDELVLSKLGVTALTNLKGNVEIPNYSGTTAYWPGETTSVTDGAGTVGTTSLSAKRLSAFTSVSMQMLEQDTLGVEKMLKDQLVAAIKQKLEATILGDATGDTTVPAGIFYNAATTTLTYADIVGLTKAAKEANMADGKWLINPTIEAALKQALVSGTKSDIKTVYDAATGKLDGSEVVVSNKAKGIAIGNWSEAILAQFGGVSITVDPYSSARSGVVNLVVNSYWDFKVARAAAVIAKSIA